MLVVGVSPTARDRCSIALFSQDYEPMVDKVTTCSPQPLNPNDPNSPTVLQPCFDRCVWEMKINLVIETLLVAAVILIIIVRLVETSAERNLLEVVLWRFPDL
jgi:hypothetical protein